MSHYHMTKSKAAKGCSRKLCRRVRLARPVKELKHFEKVGLRAGEKRTCFFPIKKESLPFYAEGPWRRFEPGLFTIMVWNHSASLIGETVKVNE